MPLDLSRPAFEWMPTVTYESFAPGLPDLVLGRLPEPLSISVGRAFKGWIIESEAEHTALAAALARPIPQPEPGRLNFKTGPDATCAGPSEGPAFLALYAPPTEGWPWLVLSAWPAARPHRTRIQRDRYIWETYDDLYGVAAAIAVLQEQLPDVPAFGLKRLTFHSLGG